LTKAGVPVRNAAALEQDLAAAEGKLSSQHVAMFSRFEGVLMMDGSGHYPPIMPSTKNYYSCIAAIAARRLRRLNQRRRPTAAELPKRQPAAVGCQREKVDYPQASDLIGGF
jgi:hypothetical protein